MFFEGDRIVLSALHEKRTLLNKGSDHTHVRPMLILLGGVMRGVYGGGAVLALHLEGFGEVFDTVVGISTGAPTCAYFLAGQRTVGTTIYSEECCTRAFINPWRLNNPCDISYLMDVFRSSERKQLDTEAVLQHRTKLIIGVTDANTAEQRLLIPQSSDEVFEFIRASISIPGLSPHPVSVRGMPCVDGSYSDPLPLPALISRYDPTHVLVVANRPRMGSGRSSILERILNDVAFRFRMSSAVRVRARKRSQVLYERLQWALSDNCPVPAAVVWGDTTVGKFTINSSIVRGAAERSCEWWVSTLRGHT